MVARQVVADKGRGNKGIVRMAGLLVVGEEGYHRGLQEVLAGVVVVVGGSYLLDLQVVLVAGAAVEEEVGCRLVHQVVLGVVEVVVDFLPVLQVGLAAVVVEVDRIHQVVLAAAVAAVEEDRIHQAVLEVVEEAAGLQVDLVEEAAGDNLLAVLKEVLEEGIAREIPKILLEVLESLAQPVALEVPMVALLR